MTKKQTFLVNYLHSRLGFVRSWRSEIEQALEEREDGSLKVLRYKAVIYEELLLELIRQIRDNEYQ